MRWLELSGLEGASWVSESGCGEKLSVSSAMDY